jgi:hypothetical protein
MPRTPPWLRRLLRPARPAGPARRRPAHGRPFLEALEDRTLLASPSFIGLVSGSDPTVAASDTAGNSLRAKASADGRFVVYASSAGNLVANQANATPADNLFLYDRQAGTTTLISHAAGSPTVTGNGVSDYPRISGDGRFIAYDSTATNLVAGEQGPSGFTNIFLYDRLSGATTLVTHAAGSPLLSANDDSDLLSTTGFGFNNNTGRFLIYISHATNLVAGQNGPPHANLFLYDTSAGTTTLVSQHAASFSGFAPSSGPTGANGDVQAADISEDGSFIAYDSLATDAVPNQVYGRGSEGVFLYNRNTGVTVAVSLAPNQPPNQTVVLGATLNNISADGTVVTFNTDVRGVVTGEVGPAQFQYQLYRYNRLAPQGQQVALVTGQFGSPTVASNGAISVSAVSRDGNTILFQSNATDLVSGQGANVGNLFLWVAGSGTSSPTLSVVSHVSGQPNVAAGGTPPNRDLVDVSISLDGRFAVYQSKAGNLVPNQTGPTGFGNVFLYDAATGASTLVSGSKGSASQGGNATSRQARITADGSAITFVSNATDLVANLNKPNAVPDVYVYTRQGPALQVVSRSAFPGAAAGIIYSTSLDGRYAVFGSNATNVVPGQVDSNSDLDVFLRDRQTGAVAVVSHVPGSPVTAGDAGSPNTTVGGGTPGVPAVISADGRFVAFVSDASNLVPGQTAPSEPWHNVFLYDVTTGSVTLVSHNFASATLSADNNSDLPAISADGRYVAYASSSNDLVPGLAPYLRTENVYLYDRVSGTTTLVSHAADGTMGNADSTNPSVDDSGRFVAYQSRATNLVVAAGAPPRTDLSTNVYLFDRTAPAAAATAAVSHAPGSGLPAGGSTSYSPVLSHDGSTVAFVSSAGNLVPGQSASPFTNVFLYGVGTGSVLLASTAGSPSAGGNGYSDSPALSADGSAVAYRSEATNLVPGQGGPAGSNIFLFSRPDSSQTLVSHASGAPATAASGSSASPVIDDAGQLVVYLSTATNLVPGQTGGGVVNNVYAWNRKSGNTGLLTGAGGSFTVPSALPSFNPVISRDPIILLSGPAGLAPGATGLSNVYVFQLVQVGGNAVVVVADGAPAGTLLSSVAAVVPFVGQFDPEPPLFTLGGRDAGAFTLGGVNAFGASARADGLALLQLAQQANFAAQPVFSLVITADAVDGAASLGVTVVVSPPQAPSLTHVADQVLDPGAGPYQIGFGVGNLAAQGGPGAVSVTASVSNATPGLLPASGGLAVGGAGAARTLTFSPVSGQLGVATVTLTASVTVAGTTLNTQTSFILTVDKYPVFPPVSSPPPVHGGSLRVPLPPFSSPTGRALVTSVAQAGISPLFDLQKQYAFQPAAPGFALGLYGRGAKWLVGQVPNSAGNTLYTLLPDGTLHAWGGSTDAVTGSSSGPIIPGGNVGPLVYANPSLLVNAAAPVAAGGPDGLAPALYARLSALEGQYDFQEIGGSWHTGLLGHQAQWVYSPLPNPYGEHLYTLTLSADGTQALLRAWQGYQDSAIGDVVATLDPSVYAHPDWLTGAAAVPDPAAQLSISPAPALHVTPPPGYVGSFRVTVTVSDGLLSTSHTITVTVTDAAPAVAPIADVSVPHRGFPTSVPVGASDADGDPITWSASAAAYSPLFALEQQYRFQGGGQATVRGVTAYVLMTADNNAFGNPYYLLRQSDGALFPYDGSGTFANTQAGTPLAALGASAYLDPSLLLKAAPPVDYAALYNARQTLNLAGVGYVTTDATAYVLTGVSNAFGSPLYLLRADGALFAYDKSGSLAHAFGGTPLANLGPGVYADPTLLLNAKAAPGLYVQLQQLEQRLDLQEVGGSWHTGLLTPGAEWLYSPVPNGKGQNLYSLVLAPGGAQALLYAWDDNLSSAVPAGAQPAAVLDPGVYADPTLLLNARAPLAAPGATASVSGGAVSVSAPASFVGTVQVTVTASDGILTSSRTFLVTSTDTPPALGALPDQSASLAQARAGAPLQVALSATDAEGDPVTFGASAPSAPGAVRVSGSVLTVDVSGLAVGTAFRLFVTADDGAETTTGSFLVTVAA